MKLQRQNKISLKNLLAVSLSLFIAIVFNLIPISEQFLWYRPEFVALVIIYWNLFAPEALGLTAVAIAGLFMDILTGSVLGQHIFLYVLIAYTCQYLRLRMRVFPLVQQTISVALIVGLLQAVELILYSMFGYKMPPLQYWFPTLSTVILWPFIIKIKESV